MRGTEGASAPEVPILQFRGYDVEDSWSIPQGYEASTRRRQAKGGKSVADHFHRSWTDTEAKEAEVTINELARLRRQRFYDLKMAVKRIDTPLEAFQRQIDSVLGRKTKVPETSDLEEALVYLETIEKMTTEASELLFGIANEFVAGAPLSGKTGWGRSNLTSE